MIYVTHDQAEAMALATDVAVMSEGRLLQMATPEDLYARPEGRLVGSLVGQGAILTLASSPGDQRQLDWAALKALYEERGMTTAEVLVRPQDVDISADGLPATVSSALFEGERYALRLTLADGQMLRAFSRSPAKVGDQVSIVIHSGWRL